MPSQNVVLITEEHGAVRVPHGKPMSRGALAPEIDALERGLETLLGRLLHEGQHVAPDKLAILSLHHGQAVAALRFYRTLDLEAKAWLP
jgi:hypothetical protein